MRSKTLLGAAGVMAVLAFWAEQAGAQAFPAEKAAQVGAAVAECTAAGARKDEAAARPAVAQATALLREWMQAEPRGVEPRVRMAAVRVRCEIPFADMMGAGALVGQANGLLEEALQIDSTHWEARFSLAMNHFHTPEFLGRTPDAIRHLEILMRQQGGGAQPHFAETYLALGDLYRRTGRADEATALWRRGAALFPADGRFAEKLGTGGDASASTPGGAADVMQAFQTAPGATRAAEGSDLYVRGGMRAGVA